MVAVKELTKYYGNKKAIDAISFTVNKGEILGFLGPNAAGKTTTMRIITCFLSASRGTVQVSGYDIFQNPIAVKKQIGYLPENPPLYLEMTVKAYLRFVGSIRNINGQTLRASMDRVIEMMNLGSVQNRVIGKLSKGFRQRVGLAQALIHNPSLLILDEPTNGLDPEQIIEVRNLIKKLGDHHTVILSTHILHEVSFTCGRVVIINKGRLVAQGTPQELTSKVRKTRSLKVEVDGPADEILSELRNMVGIVSASVQTDMQTNEPYFHLETDNDKMVAPEVAKLILAHQWSLKSLQEIPLTLEDIFLTVTKNNGSENR